MRGKCKNSCVLGNDWALIQLVGLICASSLIHYFSRSMLIRDQMLGCHDVPALCTLCTLCARKLIDFWHSFTHMAHLEQRQNKVNFTPVQGGLFAWKAFTLLNIPSWVCMQDQKTNRTNLASRPSTNMPIQLASTCICCRLNKPN